MKVHVLKAAGTPIISAFPAPTSSAMLILFPGEPSARTVMSGMLSPTLTKARGVVEKVRVAALLARSVERRSANIVVVFSVVKVVSEVWDFNWFVQRSIECV